MPNCIIIITEKCMHQNVFERKFTKCARQTWKREKSAKKNSESGLNWINCIEELHIFAFIRQVIHITTAVKILYCFAFAFAFALHYIGLNCRLDCTLHALQFRKKNPKDFVNQVFSFQMHIVYRPKKKVLFFFFFIVIRSDFSDERHFCA